MPSNLFHPKSSQVVDDPREGRNTARAPAPPPQAGGPSCRSRGLVGDNFALWLRTLRVAASLTVTDTGAFRNIGRCRRGLPLGSLRLGAPEREGEIISP